MKRIMLYYLLVVLFVTAGFSQSLTPEVLSSSGDHFTSANVQLSWTIGEVMIETYSAGPNQLTQGFHQTNLMVTAIDDLATDLELQVYPNPTSHYLTIEYQSSSASLTAQVFNSTGQLLQTKVLNDRGSTESLDLSTYPAGTYFLRIHNAANLSLKTFKILKIQ